MNRRERMAQLVEDLAEAGEALEARNANLEQAHQMDRALLSSLGEKLRYQQQLLDDAIDIAGHMSVLFPAGELEALAQRQHRESYEVHITDRPGNFSSAIGMYPESFTLRQESLKLMIAKVRPDHLSRSVHAHVKFADGEVAYGATPSAIHSMPRESLIKIITKELGMALADQLRKKA